MFDKKAIMGAVMTAVSVAGGVILAQMINEKFIKKTPSVK